MAEASANVEIAHKLAEKGEVHESGRGEKTRVEARLEIFEALLLAIVAVSTAWSGYQSARWDGISAASYAQATALRVDGDEKLTLGGQQRLQDSSTFNTWLHAKTTGAHKMAALLERRFSDDYQPSFEAWLATNPLDNPDAPPGPAFLQEYNSHLESEGAELRREATEAFELGRSSREIGEDYVRVSVFLATVLFLIAISQRFEYQKARFGLVGVAVIATVITLGLIISYPLA